MEYQPRHEKYLFNGDVYLCPLDLTMEVIGSKWKAMLLFHLQFGPLRSSELQRRIKGEISNKMFTQVTRSLEKAGVIKRTVFPVIPPKVEYELTEFGWSIIPHINALAEWGRNVGTIIKE